MLSNSTIQYDAIGSQILDVLFAIQFAQNKAYTAEYFQKMSYSLSADVLSLLDKIHEKCMDAPPAVKLFFTVFDDKHSALVDHFLFSLPYAFEHVHACIHYLCDLPPKTLHFILIQYYCYQVNKPASYFNYLSNYRPALLETLDYCKVPDDIKFELMYFLNNTEEATQSLKSFLLNILPFIQQYHLDKEYTLAPFEEQLFKSITHPRHRGLFFDKNERRLIEEMNPSLCRIMYSYIHEIHMSIRLTNKRLLLFVGIQADEYLRAKPQISSLYITDIGKALGDDMRLKILEQMRVKPMCQTDLYNALSLSNSSCFSHISVLLNAGLITPEIKGRRIYYTLHYEQFLAYTKSLCDEFALATD